MIHIFDNAEQLLWGYDDH